MNIHSINRSRCLLTGALFTSLGILPTSVAAQVSMAPRRVSVDGQLGVAVPAGRLNDYTDPGPSVGVQVGYPLTSRVALNAQGSVDFLNGQKVATVQAPDMKLWRYGGGLDVHVFQSPQRSWKVTTSLDFGATTFNSSDFSIPSDIQANFRKTYFTTLAGVTLGYQGSETSRLSGYISVDGAYANVKPEDTQVLQALDPARLRTFAAAWSIPITAGLRVRN